MGEQRSIDPYVWTPELEAACREIALLWEEVFIRMVGFVKGFTISIVAGHNTDQSMAVGRLMADYAAREARIYG